MPDLFGIDIAELVNEHIAPGLIEAKLIVVKGGTRTPGNLTGGTNPTETTITGKGLIKDYSDGRMTVNSSIKKGDREILLIANSFPGKPVPKQGDKVFIEGTTYRLIKVKRDPAAATYKCQSRL